MQVSDLVRTHLDATLAGADATAALAALESAQPPLAEHTGLQERIQLGIIRAARGDMSRFKEMLDLAMIDWRDLLCIAGLENEDWREVLRAEGMWHEPS